MKTTKIMEEKCMKSVEKKSKKNNQTPRMKNGKWLKYLDFIEVRNYLNGSINSKNAKIGNSINLEEKIAKVNLTNYLKGLEVFINEYAISPEFKEDFSYDIRCPSDIISIYEKSRTNNEEVAKFTQMVESYIVWLKEKANHSGTTATNYQAHLRGFLKWNNVAIKFRNYSEKSEKSKERMKLGIGFEELKSMSFKVLSYVSDFELKLLMQWLQISGLGSKEVININWGMIRPLFKNCANKDFIRIDSDRQKTGADFTTFAYGAVKDLIIKHIENNRDKIDSDKIFGNDTTNVYMNFQRRFRTAYDNMIDAEFPQYKSEKALFTLHGYRSVFITICAILRVPKPIENRFVAHEGDNLEAYWLESDLLKSFKMVQEELFGVTESSKDEEIEKRIIENLTQTLLNKGKRKTIFNKFEEATETERNSFENEVKMGYLVEKLLQTAKDELLQNEDFVNELTDKIRDKFFS